jgi:hypothetical protein
MALSRMRRMSRSTTATSGDLPRTSAGNDELTISARLFPPERPGDHTMHMCGFTAKCREPENLRGVIAHAPRGLRLKHQRHPFAPCTQTPRGGARDLPPAVFGGVNGPEERPATYRSRTAAPKTELIGPRARSAANQTRVDDRDERVQSFRSWPCR